MNLRSRITFSPDDPGAGGGGAADAGAAAGAAATGTAPTTVIESTVIGDAQAAAAKADPGKAAAIDGKDAPALSAADARAWLIANSKDGEAALQGKSDEDIVKLAKDAQDAAAKAGDGEITYTDFTMPEGVEVDEAQLGEAREMFKAAKLPQEQAQKFIDLYAKNAKAFSERVTQNWVDLNNKWVADFKADPDIGGDRVNETIAAIQLATDKFGTPGLREALAMTGAGNHPEVIRFFAAVGKATREARFVQANSAGTQLRPTSEVMFETMKKD